MMETVLILVFVIVFFAIMGRDFFQSYSATEKYNLGCTVFIVAMCVVRVTAFFYCALPVMLIGCGQFIQMPDMEGIRACELIHQLPHQQQTPVIAVTAHAMAGQKEKLLGAGMSDYLAKPIEEERLHNLLLRYKPGSGISSRVVTPEVNEIVVNPNATLDWQLALRQAAGKTDLARDMLQMLLDFLPEVRNKVEEQLVGENPEGLVDLIHKLHGSCGYSGVPRMKNLCQLIEQQLRSGTKEEDLEPELLELLDEMDNVAREASKILG